MNLQQNSRSCFHFLSQGLLVAFSCFKMVGPSLFLQLVQFICIFRFFSSTQFSRPNKTLYLQIITLFQEAQSFLKEIYENPLRGGLHYSNSRCSRCEEGRRLLNLLVSPMRPHPCLSSNFLRGKRIRMIKKETPKDICAKIPSPEAELFQQCRVPDSGLFK